MTATRAWDFMAEPSLSFRRAPARRNLLSDNALVHQKQIPPPGRARGRNDSGWSGRHALLENLFQEGARALLLRRSEELRRRPVLDNQPVIGEVHVVRDLAGEGH